MNSLHVKYLINSGDERIGQRGIDKFCPLCLGEGVISLGSRKMLFPPPPPHSRQFGNVYRLFFFFSQLGCVEGWGGVLLMLETMCAPPPPPPAAQRPAKIDLAQNVISAQAEKH